MSTATRSENLTEEQLLSLPHIGKAEMIDGRLIVAPAGFEHGNVSSVLVTELLVFVRRQKLGLVLDSSTGFYMRSGDLLSPDAAFVAAARLKGMRRLPRKFFKGSPDLVAEVLSPNDKPHEIERKMSEYFASDTKLAWLVDPSERSVTIYHDPRPGPILRGSDVIDGEAVIPGFKLSLDELFAQPDFD
jgi:Uma2 family endonuclease